jgi:DNA-directed RNA polymerase subunit RPC12/RpoP
MTVQEAIERVKKSDEFYHSEENKIIIQALEELEQYRELGTVEELKEAREKQVAKKPIGRHTDYKCSACGRRVRSGKGSSSRQRDNFCQRCGTKIDWEEGGTSD